MKKIRKGVFETNSSSVHSLVLAKSGLEEPKLQTISKYENGIKKNYIIAELDYFGRDFFDYKTQDEKLSYLLTILYIHDCNGDYEEFKKSWDFKNLEELILDYCRDHDQYYDGIIVEEPEDEDSVGFDHQSYDDYESIWDFKIDPVDFIFNRFIHLRTTSD